MATTGAFEDITTEIKNLYPTGSFDVFQRTEGNYRPKLKKNNDFGLNEGIVKFPWRLDGMWNVGILADNTDFPTPNDPSVQQPQLTPELFAGSIQVGVKTKAAAKSGRSTFYSKGILADRIEQCAKEIASTINKVYAGSNRGRLGIVASDGSATKTINLNPIPGTTLLNVGNQIDVYTALTSGSVRDSLSARRITALDPDTLVLTYSGADQTAVAGDSIFLASAYGQTPVGMPDIVDDGTNAATLYSITRASYPKSKAIVMGNGGTRRNLTEQLLLEAIDRPRRRFGKKVTRVLAGSGQARKAVEFAAADRRYPGATSGTPKYALGMNEESIQIVAPGVNTVMEIDWDIPPASVYCLSWDTFFLYEALPLDWIDDDALLKMIPGTGGYKSGYVAYIGSVENQGNLMPPANVRIDDLKDPILGD